MSKDVNQNYQVNPVRELVNIIEDRNERIVQLQNALNDTEVRYLELESKIGLKEVDLLEVLFDLSREINYLLKSVDKNHQDKVWPAGITSIDLATELKDKLVSYNVPF